MLKAKDIMSSNVITVDPGMGVKDFAELLWKNRISGAPVVDDGGNLTGVVTESDLIDQTKKVHIPTMISFLDSVVYLESPTKMKDDINKMSGTTVKDILSAKLVTVDEDTPLDEIATIMAVKKVHTLPVLSGSKIVGVIGKTDIIRTLAS